MHLYAEGMARQPRALPAELADPPWPEHPSGDPLGEVARQFVLNVRAAVGDRSVRSVAAAAGMSHVTLLNVLAGRVWPDLYTIARLEAALDTGLWPQHR